MFEKYEKVLEKDYRNWYKEKEAFRQQVAQDPRRLQFHLMPKTGWLNDPNGLCQHNGTYHIYYQYTPFEPTGELKLWGHYRTKDFVHYEDDGPVLFPDSDLDAHGAYSGSAFVIDDTIHYFYTGNIKYFDREDYDYINSGRGSNTITFTSQDGHHFSEKQLLFGTEEYPKDMSNHVRDPKVFCHGDTYYMVLGARDRQSKGMVLLYQSKDLKNWTFEKRITTKEPFGYMWECPDLFEIDGQWFLTCCPQGVDAKDIDFENIHQSVSMELQMDFQTMEYKIGKIHQLDRGFDFYAQQSFLDEKGRRILIGWMGIPDADYTNPTKESGWQHALTLPRELTVKNGVLCQNPIEELKELRVCLSGQYSFTKNTKKDLIPDRKDLTYEAIVDLNECQSLCMTLRKGITLSYRNHILTLDLGQYGAGRTTRKVRLEKLTYLQIFADTSSLEIFVNHGEEVFTSRIYSLDSTLTLSGDCTGSIEIYSLKPFEIEDLENK